MDNSTLAHIFEPFFNTKKIGEDAGLGLTRRILSNRPQVKWLLMSDYIDNVHTGKDLLIEKMFFI